MAQKKHLPILVIITAFVVFTIALFMIINKQNVMISTPVLSSPRTLPPQATSTPFLTDFTASFEIYTNGTKRIFTSSMYHNLSDSVYIQNPDPSLVHVSSQGITWDDFFKTLPFTLNNECLVTGTNQTFCSNKTQKLRFYINGVEQPNALQLEIKPNDDLRVIYGN